MARRQPRFAGALPAFRRRCWSGTVARARREKVIERLVVTDNATIVVDKAPEGKIRVTSGSWDGEKVFLKDRCSKRPMSRAGCMSLEKSARPDEWDPPAEKYDLCVPKTQTRTW